MSAGLDPDSVPPAIAVLHARRVQQWDRAHADPGSWAHLAQSIPDLLASGRYDPDAQDVLRALQWCAARISRWSEGDAFDTTPELVRQYTGRGRPRFDLAEVVGMVRGGQPVAEIAARYGVRPASILRRAEKHTARTGDDGPRQVLAAAVRQQDRAGGKHCRSASAAPSVGGRPAGDLVAASGPDVGSAYGAGGSPGVVGAVPAGSVAGAGVPGAWGEGVGVDEVPVGGADTSGEVHSHGVPPSVDSSAPGDQCGRMLPMNQPRIGETSQEERR